MTVDKVVLDVCWSSSKRHHAPSCAIPVKILHIELGSNSLRQLSDIRNRPSICEKPLIVCVLPVDVGPKRHPTKPCVTACVSERKHLSVSGVSMTGKLQLKNS